MGIIKSSRVIDTINFESGQVTILDSTPIPSSEHIHHNLTQNSNKMTRPQLNIDTVFDDNRADDSLTPLMAGAN
jgi:hypothetical protein